MGEIWVLGHLSPLFLGRLEASECEQVHTTKPTAQLSLRKKQRARKPWRFNPGPRPNQWHYPHLEQVSSNQSSSEMTSGKHYLNYCLFLNSIRLSIIFQSLFMAPSHLPMRKNHSTFCFQGFDGLMLFMHNIYPHTIMSILHIYPFSLRKLQYS